MNLAIISHTEHYTRKDGEIVGWGPTVTELNHLAKDFDKIYHIAFLQTEEPPPSSLLYTKPNIYFVPLKVVGGNSIIDKLTLITHLPKILKTVRHVLRKVDLFQLRTPTGMGVVLIPYLSLVSGKKGWYKYAGNWNQENPPMGYALQRWMLKRQKHIVTINGQWKSQPKHCLTFENPCLTLDERKEGLTISSNKKFQAPFTFCFVGRLEDAKGVQRIIDAFSNLKSPNKIKTIHFVGDGEMKQSYRCQIMKIGIPAHFHGFLEREKVFEIYRNSHFFLLPSSASEGFPKVIAEAMNFGVLPIVSNVSSIGQYVNGDNGFIVNPCDAQELSSVIELAVNTEEELLRKKASKAHQRVFQFTFEHYRKRIQDEAIV